MIIGTIIETALNQTGNSYNGASAVIFYTERQAVEWCRLMSLAKLFPGPTELVPATVMINTETGLQRWWYNGTEYTG